MKFSMPKISWNSEPKERVIDPPGVTPLWLVRSVNRVAWLFVIILIMTVFLRSLDIARDKAVPLEVTHAGTWVGQLAFFFPLFAPLVLAAVALPWTAKIVIPAFCTFDWKDKRQRAPKVWCGVIAVCVAIVTMTTGFPLYHGAYNERFKQEAVKLEQVDQSRAKLQADLSAIEADLKDLTNPALTTYQAQASREGAAAWAKRVAIAKAQNDYQADAIERALAAAERGDQLRKQRSEAIKALAVAPTKAAVMEQVKGAESYGSDKLVDFINAWWGFALFIVIELCALIAGWIAYMMMMLRTRQLADWEAVHNAPVAEAGIDLRLDDHSNETQVRPQETILEEDPETGELVEKIRVRYKNEDYYRKKPQRKAKPKKDDPRAAQMFDGVPEDGQNPQSEVSDESHTQGLGEPHGSTTKALQNSAGFSEAPVNAPEAGLDADEPIGVQGAEADEGGISPAQAVQDDVSGYPLDDGIQSEEITSDSQATHDQSGLADYAEADDGSLDGAALEASDEQVTWEETPEAEDAQSDGSETLLPNNEGVLVHDEDEDLERRVAKEAAE